jgi:hypothetical protein
MGNKEKKKKTGSFNSLVGRRRVGGEREKRRKEK